MRHFFIFLFLSLTALSLPAPTTASAAANAARQDYIAGTGNDAGGFAGTWEDPETGDIVNSVMAPRAPQQADQWPPIFVYPQVTPQWPPTPRFSPSSPSSPSSPGVVMPSPIQRPQQR